MSGNISKVPLSVSKQSYETYIKNYNHITHNTGKLFLFACDQKIEHLNGDFYGDGISPDDAHPEHLFKIASQARIGAFATHLGLIARYAHDYRTIPYIVKLNGKTNLVPTAHDDPISLALYSVNDVVQFQQSSSLHIAGVGYTLYLGSEYESEMMIEAAQMIKDAHAHGLVTILWCYPRGRAVTESDHHDLIAGAAGVATSLGADFVKVMPPKAATSLQSAEYLQQVVWAAGNTKVICSGGPSRNEGDFLQGLHEQLHSGGAGGAAIGRNIHQKDLEKAIKFCHAVASMIFENSSVAQAQDLLR
jgi:fructose-bisphosphate aldolase/6-deoxy-5-ketofructose 1-phosphate synthase